MAVTYNGCTFELGNEQKPSGYTVPVVSKISGEEWAGTVVLSILKATVENATQSTTMTNIFDDATIGIDKQVNDNLDADYIASQTVTAHAELIKLTTNIHGLSGSGVWLQDTAVSYLATVKVFVLAV